MAKKAKVVLNHGDFYIVNKTVADVKTLVDAGTPTVELPVTKTVANTALTTINIMEKQQPYYNYVEENVVVTTANIERVVESDVEL